MPTFSPWLIAYSTLTEQLEVVINEVSMSKVLRLRTNPWQVHKVKYLPPPKVTYSYTGFHNDQASYFNMKVHIFAERGLFYKSLLT